MGASLIIVLNPIWIGFDLLVGLSTFCEYASTSNPSFEITYPHKLDLIANLSFLSQGVHQTMQAH